MKVGPRLAEKNKPAKAGRLRPGRKTLLAPQFMGAQRPWLSAFHCGHCERPESSAPCLQPGADRGHPQPNLEARPLAHPWQPECRGWLARRAIATASVAS